MTLTFLRNLELWVSIVVTVTCSVVLFHLSHLPPSFPSSLLPSLPSSLPPPSLPPIQHWRYSALGSNDWRLQIILLQLLHRGARGSPAIQSREGRKHMPVCVQHSDYHHQGMGGGVWSHSWNAVYMHCSIVLRFMWLTPRGSYPEEEVCKCSICRDIPSIWKFLCCKIFVLLDYSCGLGHPRRFFDSIKSVLLSQLV